MPPPPPPPPPPIPRASRSDGHGNPIAAAVGPPAQTLPGRFRPPPPPAAAAPSKNASSASAESVRSRPPAVAQVHPRAHGSASLVSPVVPPPPPPPVNNGPSRFVPPPSFRRPDSVPSHGPFQPTWSRTAPSAEIGTVRSTAVHRSSLQNRPSQTPPPPPGNVPAQRYARTAHRTSPSYPVPPSVPTRIPVAPSIPQAGATAASVPSTVPTVPQPAPCTHPQERFPNDPVPIYMPRQALDTAHPQRYNTGNYIAGIPPPPADARFLVKDDGNASPRQIRCTAYAVPRDRQTCRQAAEIAMTVLSSPLAHSSDGYVLPKRSHTAAAAAARTDDTNVVLDEWTDPQQVPTDTSTSTTSPPRCKRCNGYSNPFWETSTSTCNLCGTANPQAVAGIGSTLGTVEYNVTGPYCTRPTPVQPVTVICIDLTCPTVKNYMHVMEQFVQEYALHYQRQQRPDSPVTIQTPRFGIAFCSAAGIYIPRKTESSDKQSCNIDGFVVAPDVTEDPFCPLPIEQWTFAICTQQGRDEWRTFMEMLKHGAPTSDDNDNDNAGGFLKQLIKQSHDLNKPLRNNKSTTKYARGYSLSCGGAAIAFLVDALKVSGGRAVWLSWRRPNHGVGALSDMETIRDVYKTSESSVYTPFQHNRQPLSPSQQNAASFYTKLAQECAKNSVVLDVLIHHASGPQSFLNLSTLAELCRLSCGRFIWIRGDPEWRQTMLKELLRPTLAYTGWDAVFKVRVSKGIQVKSFYAGNIGNIRDSTGLLSESPELELGCVGPDTQIMVELEHRVGGLPKNARYVYVQTALLYTNVFTGQRKVRVSTLALNVANSTAEVLQSMDFGAVAAALLKQTVLPVLQPVSEDTQKKSLKTARAAVVEKCCRLWACQQKYGAQSSDSSGLPPHLQFLPMFAVGLVKSALLRPSLSRRMVSSATTMANPRGDERAYALFQAMTVSSAATSLLMVYPLVFPIHPLESGVLEWTTPRNEVPMGSFANTPYEQLCRRPFVALPKTVVPTMTSLQNDGMYVVDTGSIIYLYIGRDVDHSDCQNAKDTLIDPQGHGDTPLGRILWQLRMLSSVGPGQEIGGPMVHAMRPTAGSVVIVEQRNGFESREYQTLLSHLVNDATPHEKSLKDFAAEMRSQALVRVKQNQV